MNLKRQENEKKKETRTYGDEHVIRFEIPPDERTISIARTRTISGFSGPGYGLEKNKRTTEFANYCCFTQQPMLFVLNEKSECADRKKNSSLVRAKIPFLIDFPVSECNTCRYISILGGRFNGVTIFHPCRK